MAQSADNEMSLIGHLAELRTRLIVSLSAIVICTIVSFFIADNALTILTEPIQNLATEPGHPDELQGAIEPDGTIRLTNLAALKDPDKISRQRIALILPADPAAGRPEPIELVIGTPRSQKLRYKNPIDPFAMQFKIALILGVLFALPVILVQIWKFVVPGLTRQEERVVRPLLCAAVIVFPLGAAFAYVIMRMLLVVMQGYTVPNIEPLYDVSEYLSLLTTMMLIFGLIFELPLALGIAARIGLIHPRMLTQWRKHAYVGLAVAAMVLTPSDGYTMLAVFFPMILLYELSVLICKPLAKAREKEQLNRESRMAESGTSDFETESE